MDAAAALHLDQQLCFALYATSRAMTQAYAPVLAPLGTAARPIKPVSVHTSASMVGFPRLSRISRAIISRIALMFCLLSYLKCIEWYLVYGV